MGLFANIAKQIREEAAKFEPLELCEINVQAIFNRCLAKEPSEETVSAALFPVITGYSAINNEIIYFNKAAILSNKRAIEYLFGQLEIVHSQSKKERYNIKEFTAAYSGKIWAESRGYLLQLLYLGVTPDINQILPFSYRDNNSAALRPDIKPTLSPKDPNFPAWWEAHKGEWEE